MMGLVGRLTKIDGRQEGENKRLQERNEQFETIHENHERRGEHADSVSRRHGVATLSENQDQADE